MFYYGTCVAFITMLLSLLSAVKTDVLETERSSFLGFTHEVVLSLSTMELAEQLQQAVYRQGRGERRVRRYFDAYNTPFIGPSRRKLDWA